MISTAFGPDMVVCETTSGTGVPPGRDPFPLEKCHHPDNNCLKIIIIFFGEISGKFILVILLQLSMAIFFFSNRQKYVNDHEVCKFISKTNARLFQTQARSATYIL